MNTKEKSDKSTTNTILENVIALDLGMASENEPYIIAMNFVYQKDRIYLHSATTGTKIQYLKKNNRVCFLVRGDKELVASGHPCSFGMRYRSVIGTGKASFIKAPDDKAKVLSLFVSRYGGDKNSVFSTDRLEKVCVICIEITSFFCKIRGY